MTSLARFTPWTEEGREHHSKYMFQSKKNSKMVGVTQEWLVIPSIDIHQEQSPRATHGVTTKRP